jgi:hypothetical protein
LAGRRLEALGSEPNAPLPNASSPPKKHTFMTAESISTRYFYCVVVILAGFGCGSCFCGLFGLDFSCFVDCIDYLGLKNNK